MPLASVDASEPGDVTEAIGDTVLGADEVLAGDTSGAKSLISTSELCCRMHSGELLIDEDVDAFLSCKRRLSNLCVGVQNFLLFAGGISSTHSSGSVCTEIDV